jgi:hypothetical protein
MGSAGSIISGLAPDGNYDVLKHRDVGGHHHVLPFGIGPLNRVAQVDRVRHDVIHDGLLAALARRVLEAHPPGAGAVRIARIAHGRRLASCCSS